MKIKLTKDPDFSDYVSCPFRSDVNSCKICRSSKINDCPKSDFGGDDLKYSLPEYCPLLLDAVIVELEK